MAALIVLNEINVSGNSNEDALLMKADQIRATWGRLKRRELDLWGSLQLHFTSINETKCVFGIDNNTPKGSITLQDALRWVS